MKEEQFMEEARMIAAQCWCDDENKATVMDPALAESFARRLAAWMDTAAMFSRNEEFYRGLVDRCAKALGSEAYTDDGGTLHDSPIRLKVPELVEQLTQAR